MAFVRPFSEYFSGGRYQLGQLLFCLSSLRPRHIHVRGASSVRGIGESLAYRFSSNDHLRGGRLIVTRRSSGTYSPISLV